MITDVDALFSLEDASVIKEWSNRISAVTTKSYMRGYRDIYKDVNLLHKLLIKFCDSKVNMNIVKRYVVEPMALIFNEDNYYLMCFSSKYDGVTNYRVDRMDEVAIEDKPVSEKAIIPDDDIADYTEQVFKMYNGPATDITIEFDDKLIGVIQDKFGEDTKIVRTSKDRYVASIKVQISPVFWGWIFQFVGEMSIGSPEEIKNDYKKRIFDAVNM